MLTNGLFSSVEKLGGWRLKRLLSPNTLTVLNYHRVLPIDEDSKSLFMPNVSATPEMFANQMAYLAKNYRVISVDDLVDWFNGGEALPTNAALITFDDGYLDNYEYAFPILREYGFSAVIFLTTNFLDRELIFFWDLIAYCIDAAESEKIYLSRIGEVSLQGDKQEVVKELVNRVKYYSEDDKKAVLRELADICGVSVGEEISGASAMSWGNAAEMVGQGIEFGGHTVNHPILSKVADEEAVYEISESKRIIEEKIQREVLCFAYPNGQVGDFTARTQGIVRESGYQVAFSLISGPSALDEVRQGRYEIRRIFLSHRDSMPRFIAKLNGLARLKDI